MAVLGIFLSLGLLILLAYKGYSVIFFAPIFALLAAVLSGMALMPTYTEIFLPALANYVKVYFPFFLLGAVFGKAMEETGAAESIAKAIVDKLGTKQAILAVVLACLILTYGGVSLFVVAFAVYPFAASLFKQAGVPKRLLPGTIALGSFTVTMTAIPGTPQIQNAIPMKFFNTDLWAAPVFGIISTILILGSGMAWLEYRKRKAQAAGEGYGNHTLNEPELVDNKDLPNPWVSLLPLAFVLVSTLILQKFIFPNWDIASWVTQAPYNIAKTGVLGTMNNWALIIALVIGIGMAFAINPKKIKGNLAKAINIGAIGSLLAVMNTASEVGYGNVIKTLPGFKTIATFIMSIGGSGSPLPSEAVAVTTLAGITGSASGGMSIALEAFGKQYLEWATRMDVSPELLHRVASVASGGLDTLPHNGAVITLLGIVGMTHKDSYVDIGMVSALIPVVTVFVVIFLQGIIGFI